jgi:hypothetical protein
VDLKIVLGEINANPDKFFHGRSCMGIYLSSHGAS